MFISMTASFKIMLGACFIGVLLGILFEFFRLCRQFKNGFISVFLFDFIFFLLASMVITKYCIQYNDGQMRWFILPACLIGFTVYRISLGKWLYRPILFLTKKFFGLLKKICCFIFSPLVYLLHKFCRLLGRIFSAGLKFLKKPFIFLKKCYIIKSKEKRSVSERKNENGKSQKEEKSICFYH